MQTKIVMDLRQQNEVERIHEKLMEFLPAPEARETAMRICGLALDIDEEIDRILEDPLVGRLYEYDGRFFTQRGMPVFHTAFNGLHLLKSLTDSVIETFFRGRKKRSAVRWLLEELDKHTWVAKRRRLNWEESRTLGLLTPEVIQELMEIHERARQISLSPPPLSPEEQAFFQYFEDETASPDSVGAG